MTRTPKKVNDTDLLFAANLLNAQKAAEAVKGSKIVYSALGLLMNTQLWETQFPVIMRNTIDACKHHGTKLVFFDNTYMYPQDGRLLTENTPFYPVGKKGKVRKELAEMVLKEMQLGELGAVICRAPEFYGPGKTQSITNTLVFDNIKENKRLKVPLSDSNLRRLIWTPEASRPTYKQFIALASEVYGRALNYSVIPRFVFKVGALFNNRMKELQELLPRYEYDNLFDDSKFKQYFPDFETTSYRQGMEMIKNGFP